VFEQLQALLLDELGAAGRMDLARMGRHRWTIERTGVAGQLQQHQGVPERIGDRHHPTDRVVGQFEGSAVKPRSGR
jgi:hypothetical protein